MNRRALLAALAAGVGSGVAGCRAGAPGSGTTDSGADGGSSQAATDSLQVGGVDLPVPSDEIETRLPKDSIPAITEPEFARDWQGVAVDGDSSAEGDAVLPGDAPVVGVAREGEARAYPLRILDWHEAVNDTFGGPLLVTYCPLCGSAVTAERRVDGQETIFGVSGRLWRDDLVLYDRATESWWSQLLATAIRGPRTGEQLTLVPSSLTTWDEWRGAHPNTRVLLPPPESNTVRGRDETFSYGRSKYGYDEEQLIGRGESADDEPAERRLVIGVTADSEARAYPFDLVAGVGVVNDRVGDLPVVVTVTPGNTLVAYDRRIDGTTLSFAVGDEAHLRAEGSRWERATGRAVDGPAEGRQLRSATDVPAMFWKGWRDFHPETDVYEGE